MTEDVQLEAARAAPRGLRRFVLDTTPLAIRPYRRLWSSTIVTAVGSQLTAVLVAAVAAVLGLPAIPPREGVGRRAGLREVAAGFRYLSMHAVLLVSFLADIIAMVFGMPRALFPEMASRTFDGVGSGLALGILFAAIPAGSLLGGLPGERRSRRSGCRAACGWARRSSPWPAPRTSSAWCSGVRSCRQRRRMRCAGGCRAWRPPRSSRRSCATGPRTDDTVPGVLRVESSSGGSRSIRREVEDQSPPRPHTRSGVTSGTRAHRVPTLDPA